MSEHHVEACETYESQEVLDVIFPSRDESAEVVHPGGEPLHFPSFAVAPQLAPVLSSLFAPSPVGCIYHFESVLDSKLFVERV